MQLRPPLRRRDRQALQRTRSRHRRRRNRLQPLRRGPNGVGVERRRGSREERPDSGHRRRFQRPGTDQFRAGETIPVDSVGGGGGLGVGEGE